MSPKIKIETIPYEATITWDPQIESYYVTLPSRPSFRVIASKRAVVIYDDNITFKAENEKAAFELIKNTYKNYLSTKAKLIESLFKL